jgi:hypothetical protein
MVFSVFDTIENWNEHYHTMNLFLGKYLWDAKSFFNVASNRFSIVVR